MEIRFVDAPNDVLDQFEGRIRELAEEFRSMGGVFIAALAMRDELQDPREDHRFIVEPPGIASFGLSHLMVEECIQGMYEAERVDGEP